MLLRKALPILCILILNSCQTTISKINTKSKLVDRTIVITPDFSGIVIPPNIAPLNFAIKESGIEYAIKISSKHGNPITIISQSPAFHISEIKWKTLLEQNRGEVLRINTYVCKKTDQWLQYKPIFDTIATESIDRNVTYRILNCLYNVSRDVRICERNLESFSERELINSTNFVWGCCNCHTPKNNDPSSFVVQTRSTKFGSAMLLSNNGVLSKISSKFGYPAWHPDGKLIAFAVYKVRQCFHEEAKSLIDVYDNASDIVVYDVESKKTYTVPDLFQKQALETWPTWSTDGDYLYFCSAPILWTNTDKVPPDNFDKVKYSLLRIPYDKISKSWGQVDTVLSCKETGLSISQPRISPNGKFLIFCMHEYGGYPHTQKSSDLYIMNVLSNKYWKLNVNSDYSESWHDWSKDGRWILFSSKRNSGIFTRIYFSYIDSSGFAHKPFIMPQKDPSFYDSFIKMYNYPEFATGPIPFSERELLKAIRSPANIIAAMPVTPDSGKQNPNFQ